VSQTVLVQQRSGRLIAQADPYECGFEPYTASQHRFLVFFYIVGILFIVFDLELLYVVPWLLDMGVAPRIDPTHAGAAFIFILFLVAAFVYE